MKKNLFIFRCILCLMLFTWVTLPCESATNKMYWWASSSGINFGDDLSRVIVEKILGRPVEYRSLSIPKTTLFTAGSILHYARNDDIVWGSGFREDPSMENRFERLDVRAVRGPRTRDFLLKKGVVCPEIYGDPAVLMSDLFPEFQPQTPLYDYIIIPNVGELECFSLYKNVVSPLLPWEIILEKMMQARLVISGSLHGLIMAESYGIPARLLKMTWGEPLLKYEDYYESTGRPNFQYATSVLDALKMGGETPRIIDTKLLLDAFPWDYFNASEDDEIEKGNSQMSWIDAHPDLLFAKEFAYDSNGFFCTNFLKENESQEYGASQFEMDQRQIKFRVSKITPIKAGQFVTFWKRIGEGEILPYDAADPFDFLVISVRTPEHFGQFVFPKLLLLEKGIISKEGKGGKRAMRIYPPWVMAESFQARKTQAWQRLFFFEIKPNQGVDSTLVRNLFGQT